ncbi:MAG: phospholipase A [Desulfuromonas sp.]|nr:phospholipase A [Desulfuromonas sp.]
MIRSLLLCLLFLCCLVPLAGAQTPANTQINAQQRQLLNAIESGQYDQLSVGELRRMFVSKALADAQIIDMADVDGEPSAVARRRNIERATVKLPFAIVPHRRNYLLPITYNSHVNSQPFEIGDDDIDCYEVKFQFSFKVPVWQNIFRGADLWAAYTNLSFWQAYNHPFSSPFRETNHEPELFLRLKNDWQLLGLKNSLILLGATHQSNGQTGSLSRSWNRVYLNMIFERGGFVMGLKPWYRIPEDQKDDPTSSSGDDNPDIEKYLGYGELTLGYKWRDHVVSMMLRNNLRGHNNKGAVQFDWTFPLSRKLRGYVQFFNGYGESLIDYNTAVNRIGAGVVLSDLF